MSLWNIGGALLGGLFGGGDKEQTTTQERSPWGPAQPWMQNNINSGQHLQSFYQQNPFSQPQLDAYANSAGLTNQFRNVAGSLVNQMSNQRGFDRMRPLDRPQAYNFGAPYEAGGLPGAPGGSTGGAGGLGFTNPFTGNWMTPAAPPAMAPASSGVFDWASGSGGPPNDPVRGTPGTFAFDPRSYTGGILPALLGRQNPAPVFDQWGGSVGSDGGYGGIGGQTGGDGAIGFGGVY